MDYRDLLIRYMAHVGDEEGIIFLGPRSRPTFISEEQWQELHLLDSESQNLCRHANVVEGVDDDSQLIEPAYDVCVDCGEQFR